MRKLPVLLLCALAGCWQGGCQPGESVRVGQIIAVTHASNWLGGPTWDAEILRGSLQGGSGSFGTPYWFTVSSDSLLRLVQEAADSGYEVKVHYTTESLCSNNRSKSGCDFLTSITRLKP